MIVFRWWRGLMIGLVAFVTIVATSWSLLPSSFFRVHDYTHVARIVEMRQALVAGEVPPIWAMDLGNGYGMPLFLFYGPLPTFLATLTTFVGFSPLAAVRLLILGANLLAFFGTLRLMRRYGYAAALVSAVFFTVAPYRAVDTFARGALNELFALSLLPWILDAFLRIHPKHWRTFLPAAVWSAALILSHNLTALMALPMIGVVAGIWHGLRPDRLRAWALMLAASVTSVLLSVFYAAPAVLEHHATVIDSILGGYFDYRLHFLYIRQFWFARWGYGGSQFGPDDGITFHIGIVAWVAIVMVGIGLLRTVWFWLRHRGVQSAQHTPAWWIWRGTLAAAAALSLFLTLEHARPIWAVLPVLNYIQFPWRFLAPATLWLAVLAGIAVADIHAKIPRWAVGFLLIVILWVTQARYHRPERFLQPDEMFYSDDRDFIRREITGILPDFLPNTLDRELPPVTPEERIAVTGPELKTNWDRNTPQTLRVVVEGNGPATITWNIADFVGWQYFVNDAQVEPELLADGRRQLVTSENVGSVGARISTTPLRHTTIIISSLTAVAVFAFLIPWKKERHE